MYIEYRLVAKVSVEYIVCNIFYYSLYWLVYLKKRTSVFYIQYNK